MRKLIVSALLLAALCAVSLWSTARLEALCARTEGLLALSEGLLAAGDTEAAERFAAEARGLWEAAEGYTHIFYRHDTLNTLNESFLVYESALRETEASAPGALRLLRARLTALLDEERLSLRSLI